MAITDKGSGFLWWFWGLVGLDCHMVDPCFPFLGEDPQPPFTPLSAPPSLYIKLGLSDAA